MGRGHSSITFQRCIRLSCIMVDYDHCVTCEYILTIFKVIMCHFHIIIHEYGFNILLIAPSHTLNDIAHVCNNNKEKT